MRLCGVLVLVVILRDGLHLAEARGLMSDNFFLSRRSMLLITSVGGNSPPMLVLVVIEKDGLNVAEARGFIGDNFFL